jgi:hypothetical protein
MVLRYFVAQSLVQRRHPLHKGEAQQFEAFTEIGKRNGFLTPEVRISEVLEQHVYVRGLELLGARRTLHFSVLSRAEVFGSAGRTDEPQMSVSGPQEMRP